MKAQKTVQRKGSRKYLVAGVTVSTAVALARPIYLARVYAADNQYEWTKQVDLDRLGGYYTSAAVSADGSHLITGVTNGGENTDPFTNSPLYISQNYGASWENVAAEIDPDVQHHWNSVDVSNDGQIMVASSDWGNDFVHFAGVDGITVISEDGGDTWTDITPETENQLYNTVVSGDGSKIVAIDNDEHDLRVSDNGGDTWSTIIPSVDSDTVWNIESLSVSDNGNKILIGGENGTDSDYTTDLFLSDDSGDTWSNISPNPGIETYFISHDLSADGSKIIASEFGNDGDPYDAVSISTNDGDTWNDITPAHDSDAVWRGVAVSDDGTTVSLFDDNANTLYLSGNSGTTWTEEDPGQTYEDENGWSDIDFNEDGSEAIVAGEENVYLTGGHTLAPTVSLDDAEGGKTITITTPQGTTITCHSAVKESGLSASDGIYSYPVGLVDFCFSGADTDNEVSLVFVTDLKPNQVTVRKYNPTSKLYTTVTGASVTETTSGGHHALQVTYTITDNGPLDTDADVGEIADPVGLGTLDVTVPNTGFGPTQN